jgi:hypothetical protein
MGDSEQAQQGLAFVVTCQHCGHSRLVHRDEVISGRWMDCPYCFEPDEEERERVD